MEIWCEDFTPDTFCQQTHRTFVAALRGKLERKRREAERDLFVAYHAGLFSRASKPRAFSYYLERMRAEEDQSRGGIAVLGLLRSLQADGVQVDIKRLN